MKKHILISKIILVLTISIAMLENLYCMNENFNASKEIEFEPYEIEFYEYDEGECYGYGDKENLKYILENSDQISFETKKSIKEFLELDDDKKTCFIQKICQTFATTDFKKTEIILNKSQHDGFVYVGGPLILRDDIRDLVYFFRYSEPTAYSLAYSLIFRDKNFFHGDEKTSVLKSFLAGQIANAQLFPFGECLLNKFFSWLIKNPNGDFKTFIEEDLEFSGKHWCGEGAIKRAAHFKRALRIFQELQRREANDEPWYIGDNDDLYKK